MTNEDDGVKEIVYRQDIPKISIERRKESSGIIIEQEFVSVQGYSLKECKTILDQIEERGKR